MRRVVRRDGGDEVATDTTNTMPHGEQHGLTGRNPLRQPDRLMIWCNKISDVQTFARIVAMQKKFVINLFAVSRMSILENTIELQFAGDSSEMKNKTSRYPKWFESRSKQRCTPRVVEQRLWARVGVRGAARALMPDEAWILGVPAINTQLLTHDLNKKTQEWDSSVNKYKMITRQNGMVINQRKDSDPKLKGKRAQFIQKPIQTYKEFLCNIKTWDGEI